MKTISLQGRKALITGGSRGIGAGICRVLAECGADVAFTYHANDQAANQLLSELSGNSVKVLAKKVSAEDESGMATFIDSVAHAFGGLNILVVNAAYGQVASLNELSLADWRKGIEINLTAAFLAIQKTFPHLCQSERGDIILIGSSASYDGGGPVPYYATAKAGLKGLVRHLMRELSSHNIHINAVHPCLVDTDGLGFVHDTPEKLDAIRAQVPLSRLSKPEDVANLVAFLCSDLCEFITGQSILVDGGRTLWKKSKSVSPPSHSFRNC